VSIHLVAGQGVATRPAAGGQHLPSARVRRYPSDTSNAEWRLIDRHVPAGCGRGRPPCYSRRDIVDAIRYLAHNGCVWRALPVDFPPWRTVYHYFRAWTRDGTLTRLHAALRDLTRCRLGRRDSPTAAIADSQSVRTAETVARPNRGYDAGKKVNGRKRHIVVDTGGLLLVVLVTAANVQDRDAGRLLLHALRITFPTVAKVWVDGGYAGQLVTWAATTLHICVEVVTKLAGQVGFHVLPRRWVVERTLSWITRNRRTVRDYERLPEHHAAFIHWAMITIMARRLTRQKPNP
jgi:transposase